MTINPTDDPRLAAVKDWLHALPRHYGLQLDSLRAASNDASFRRYFRVDSDKSDHPAFVVMDAPPPMEDCRPFVRIADVLVTAGVNAPKVFEADLDHGFLLLQDFGNRVYLNELNQQNATSLYGDAIRSLVRQQIASQMGVLPLYDEALLRRELMLYPEWYLARHKGLELSAADQKTLHEAFNVLISNNLAQPQVFVHRDYHSRNLMILDGSANPGVLDFQDAVYGPITYDLVSLFRDAYIRWEEPQVLDWCIRYWEQARRAKLPVSTEFGDFYRDFEWMGLQRHLKILGIFARLCYRDGKDRYLKDMPLVLEYVLKATARYRAFDRLTELIERVENGPRSTALTF